MILKILNSLLRCLGCEVKPTFHLFTFNTYTKSGVKITPDELQFVRTVGTGSCGEVFEALWKGTRVAVKKVFKSTHYSISFSRLSD